MKFEQPVAAQIPGLKQLWKACFGDEDAFIGRFFAVAFAPTRCRCVTDGEAVLAAAYWFDVEFSGNKAAYIYAVATDPAHRGQGLCRKLMDTIHSHLAESGYIGAMLVPGDDGLREMYGKMDYVNFGGMEEFACAAGDSSLAVQQIATEEYANLRRTFLPENGVVQEKENLNFLRQFYRFYRADGCVFAAASTGSELFVAELLGDRAAAPGILAALGMPSGVFRVPGNDAFAMYRSLDGKDAPGYFAFAFD